MSESFLEAIQHRVLLGDGAMGTQFQQVGLEPGGCGEAWNVTHPQRVLAIQKQYVDAGSDCLLTNTFGGSRIMLERYGQTGDLVAINKGAVQIARDAFGDRAGFVIGDMGPFGGLMEPLGDVPVDAVREAFGEQARILVGAGVDAIIIETQTALEELELGIEAARQAGAPCIIGSMAFDVTMDKTRLRTMMGVSPEQAAEFMRDQGVDVVALNCGTGVDAQWATRAVELYRSACDLPTMTQPNAGQPVLENLQVKYKQTPEEMAAEIPALLSAGPRIVGGCCGSTPQHIRKIRYLIDEFSMTTKQ